MNQASSLRDAKQGVSMKKSTRILLGIATIWPIVYMIFFFTVIFIAIFSASHDGSFEGSALPALLMVIFPLHILTVILVMGLTIFYIVNVFRNDRVDKDKQILWTILLFMGSIIVMPVYWYLYIWSERKEPSFDSTDRRALHNADAPNWMNDATSREYGRKYGPPPPPPDWR
jgi:heme/copper-type cytochrome/quinol oxidase subunit 2